MKLNLFQKWALATLLATLFLVFVGGFVRASGAGLGCPDWPRCWGKWWPPSSVEAVDAAAYDVSQFNAAKMWIEYINRLVGVAVGIFILGTFILSLPYRRSDPAVMWGALAAFLLVGFQGWLGGKVVESNLRGGMVTIHMAVAVVLLSLLIWVAYRSAGDAGRIAILGGGRRRLRATVGVLFFLSVIQVLLGARVREDVDEIAGAGGPLERPEWLGAVGEVFVIHRTFAWALVAATVVVLWSARRGGLSGWGKYAVWTVGVVIAGQVISGAALAYFGLPPAFQVVHLGLSTVLCSLCYLVWIALRPGAPVPVSGAGRWLDADGQPRSTA